MASGNRFRRGGRESFYQRRVLFEDYTAGFARAFISGLSERRVWNRVGRFARRSEIYSSRRLRIGCAFNRGFSGEYFYGIERRTVSRI